MINRFDQFAPLDFKMAETPLQPLMMALESKQRKFDTNAAASEELRNKYIDALQQDQPRAFEKVQGWQTKIDEMVDTYAGDYSRITKDLMSMRREVAMDFSPQGEAGAMQANKLAWTEALKREQDKLAKGDITESQLNTWAGYNMSNYTGVGQRNPLTNTFNQLNPDNIANFVDGREIMRQAAEDVVAAEGGSEWYVGANGWMIKKGNKWEVVSPERIEGAVMRAISGDVEFGNMISQYAKHSGTDPNELFTSMVGNWNEQMKTTFSKDNVWRTEDRKVDPFVLWSHKRQGIEEMLAPRGRTAPGLTEATGFGEAGKINVMDKVGLQSPYGRDAAAAQQFFMHSQNDKDRYNTNLSASEYWQQTRTKNRKLRDNPLLQKAWDASYKEAVTNSKDWGSMTNLQQQEAIRNSYNTKIENLPENFNTTDVLLSPTATKVLSSQITSSGAAFSPTARWHKIQDGNKLGDAGEAPKAIREERKAGKAAPVSFDRVATINGVTGVVVNRGNDSYIISGVLDDYQMSALEPLKNMTEVYRTGEPVESIVRVPALDQSGRIVGYSPESLLSIKLDSDFNRQVTITSAKLDKSGKVVYDKKGNVVYEDSELTPQQQALLESNFGSAASVEIQRGVDMHSNFINQMDPKGVGDAPNYYNLLTDE